MLACVTSCNGQKTIAKRMASGKDIESLLKEVEERFPATLREDKWYLTAVSLVLTGFESRLAGRDPVLRSSRLEL